MKRIFHTGHFYLHPARQYPALYRRDGRIDCMAPARERDARWRRFGTRYRPGRHPAGALRHIPPHLCRQWRCGGAEGRAFPCPVRRPIRSFMSPAGLRYCDALQSMPHFPGSSRKNDARLPESGNRAFATQYDWRRIGAAVILRPPRAGVRKTRACCGG